MKWMITGGAGFIGAHLTRRLVEQGARVDLVDDHSRGARDETVKELEASGLVRLIESDLRHPGALVDADLDYDYVVHLAAVVGVANVVARPGDVLRNNVSMLDEALGLARRQRALRRFVFPSTSEVYAGTLEHFTLPIPTPERTPLALPDLARPRTAYMLSKIFGEAMTQHAGLPFTIVRPHNVYGPRMGLNHVIPELLQRAHAATDGRLDVYSVDHRRTFCYIDDAIELLARAAESPQCEGETLNIGSHGPEISIEELARIVIEVVGKDLEIVPLAATPGSPERRRPDVTRIVSLTSYAPRIGLHEGIERTYAAYAATVFEPLDVIA